MRRLVVFHLTFLLCLLTTTVFAQFPPRVEDHFWRRKVVNRIDLNEKVNYPFIMRESKYYNQYASGVEKRGFVSALMNGLKQGKFVAYDADSLDKALTYDQVMSKVREASGAPSDSGDGGDGGDNEDFDDVDGGGGGDDGGGGGDDWGFSDDGGDGGDEKKSDEPVSWAGGDEYAALESYFQFVEDRIFNKATSDMVYDIQYLELIWVDPGEVLRDRSICTFKYKEVMEELEKAQWKNKFNDAEYRNFREVFELRMFNSFILNVSDIAGDVQSLQEAEFRRQQLVEFEHHLWSY
ncbi:MAG: hypothetical protein ACKVTZ_11680 [Bacteroidia bacterium]